MHLSAREHGSSVVPAALRKSKSFDETSQISDLLLFRYHFGCLPKTLQADISRTIKAEENAARVAAGEEELVSNAVREDKKEMDVSQRLTVPACAMCARTGGTVCSRCGVDDHAVAAKANESVDKADATMQIDAKLEISVVESSPSKNNDNDKTCESDDVEMVVPSTSQSAVSPLPTVEVTSSSPLKSKKAVVEDSEDDEVEITTRPIKPLLFRCYLCTRPSHYKCLPFDRKVDGFTEELNALYWQQETEGQAFSCEECDVWGKHKIDVILAWRPLGAEDNDPALEEYELPTVKSNASAEYLVKWAGYSYRDVEWLPHGYSASLPFSLLVYV